MPAMDPWHCYILAQRIIARGNTWTTWTVVKTAMVPGWWK